MPFLSALLNALPLARISFDSRGERRLQCFEFLNGTLPKSESPKLPGSVIVQAYDSSQWYRLTPDLSGSYVNGTWTALPLMPTGYGPLNYASAVLGDGRVVIFGGEINLARTEFTNQGAIYNPFNNTWTRLTGPGWAEAGRAPAVVQGDQVDDARGPEGTH